MKKLSILLFILLFLSACGPKEIAREDLSESEMIAVVSTHATALNLRYQELMDVFVDLTIDYNVTYPVTIESIPYISSEYDSSVLYQMKDIDYIAVPNNKIGLLEWILESVDSFSNNEYFIYTNELLQSEYKIKIDIYEDTLYIEVYKYREISIGSITSYELESFIYSGELMDSKLSYNWRTKLDTVAYDIPISLEYYYNVIDDELIEKFALRDDAIIYTKIDLIDNEKVVYEYDKNAYYNNESLRIIDVENNFKVVLNDTEKRYVEYYLGDDSLIVKETWDDNTMSFNLRYDLGSVKLFNILNKSTIHGELYQDSVKVSGDLDVIFNLYSQNYYTGYLAYDILASAINEDTFTLSAYDLAYTQSTISDFLTLKTNYEADYNAFYHTYGFKDTFEYTVAHYLSFTNLKFNDKIYNELLDRME